MSANKKNDPEAPVSLGPKYVDGRPPCSSCSEASSEGDAIGPLVKPGFIPRAMSVDEGSLKEETSMSAMIKPSRTVELPPQGRQTKAGGD